MTWKNYEAAMLREFPRGTRVRQTRGGVSIDIPCAEGHTKTVGFNKRMPPDKAHKHAANMGWRFTGSKPLCPEHATPPPTKMKEPAPMLNDNASSLAIAMSDAGLQSSDKAREARRLATMLIDEKFDVTRGCYRDNFSDAKVAHEAGVSEKWVATRREEDFGPLKEPPEIAAFREKIADLEAQAAKIREDAEGTVKALLAQIGQLRTSLEVLARRNGW